MTEEKKEEKAQQPKVTEKKISLQEFLAEKSLKPKSLADYAVVYLRKKVGAMATRAEYEAAVTGFLNKKS